MLSYQNRVVQDMSDLKAKLQSMHDFMSTIDYQHLSKVEQELLHKQSVIMGVYADVLVERIELFK